MTNEELVKRIQSGENVSGNMLQLYQQNAGLICRLAKQYSRIAETDDLKQEAYIVLDKAAKQFDCSAGYKFITYFGTSLERHFRQYCNDQCPVKVSQRFGKLKGEYSQKKKELLQQTSGDLNDAAVMAVLEMSPATFHEFMKTLSSFQVISLDAKVPGSDAGDSDAALYDLIPDETDFTDQIADQEDRKRLQAAVRDQFDRLTKRQKQTLYYTVIKGKSLKETAELLHISRQAVSQSRNAALKKMLKCDQLQRYAAAFDYCRSASYTGNYRSYRASGCSSVERVALKHIELEEQAAEAATIYEVILNMVN